MWEELYELETSEWGEAPAGVEMSKEPEPDDVPF
jgi:hypothetical protein